MISCLYEKGLFDIFRGNQFHLIVWVISYQGENDQSKVDERKPEGLTIYKPGDQVFPKLHLCEYLRELYGAAGNTSFPEMGSQISLPISPLGLKVNVRGLQFW
jgi:hypothetical protein